MNGLKLGALVALVAAVGLLAYAAATGEAQGGLFLVFPFLVGSGPTAFLAMLLLVAAFFLLAAGQARDLREAAGAWRQDPAWAPRAAEAPTPPAEGDEGKKRVRTGGVVLLGPIPIVWGNDRRILPWMVLAGLLLLAATVLVQLSLR